MPLKRIAFIFTSAALVAGVRAAETEKLDKELEAMLAELPTWSISTSLDAAYGYRDNLLLSTMDEESSAFVRGVAELMLLRVPTGKLDYSFFIQGQRTRFFEAVTVDDTTLDHEASAWAQSDLGYRLTDSLRVGLPLAGYYTDRVFDITNLETNRNAARLSVRGAMISPVVKWKFLTSWWVEAQGSSERKRYRDGGSNDGTVEEGAVRLGWTRGERFEAQLAGVRRRREYENRMLKTPAGREIRDTVLKISEQEFQGRVDIGWDKANRWRTTTTVSLLEYDDTGEGYYNYREKRVDHELEWTDERWLVRLTGTASRQDFVIQEVDSSDGSPIRPKRLRDDFQATLHLERTLTSRWTALASYRWERTRSNDFFAGYRMNEGLLGLRWSWDK